MAEEDILREILRILRENYPTPEDEDAYVSMIVDAPAGSVTTVVFELNDVWDYYIDNLYVDAASGCTYEWFLSSIIAEEGVFSKTLYGNEHHFKKKLVAKSGSYIRLKITNTGVDDQNLDIVLDMWGREKKE